MKSTCMLLLTTLVLGAGTLASAAEPPATVAATTVTAAPATATVAPATPPDAPTTIAAGASLFCSSTLSLASTLALPQPIPSPVPLTTYCGACSSARCQNAVLNSLCFDGNYGNCITPYGNYCSDGNPQCQCWHGPLP
jgi:hypothetical protein